MKVKIKLVEFYKESNSQVSLPAVSHSSPLVLSFLTAVGHVPGVGKTCRFQTQTH